MTNYYKVYLQKKNGSFVKQTVKKKEQVRQIIKGAEGMNYYRYIVVKSIKGGADIFAESGYFTKEARVVVVDRLDVDYKIVAGSVIIDNRGKLIKEEREEERE